MGNPKWNVNVLLVGNNAGFKALQDLDEHIYVPCRYRALKRLSIHRDPLLVADMLVIVARAAGEYGCEVWATPWLDKWHLHDCPLQRSHVSILKRCLEDVLRPAGTAGR